MGALIYGSQVMVAKVREATADLGGALQAAVKSSNHLSRDVADKFKAETDQAWKRMLSLLDTDNAGSLGKVRASAVRGDDGLL